MIEETRDQILIDEEEFEESEKVITEEEKDDLEIAIEEQMKKIQMQNLLLGAQSACSVVMNKIIAFEEQPGKRSLNDHRRLVKDIKAFCETALSKKVNQDGTISPVEEDNTKLMEE